MFCKEGDETSKTKELIPVKVATFMQEASPTEIVTVCAPEVAVFVVETETTPAELIVNSVTVSAATPEAGTSLIE